MRHSTDRWRARAMTILVALTIGCGVLPIAMASTADARRAKAVEAPVQAVERSAQPVEQPRQPPATDEFVPVSELPPDEQLPAAPFLISAYAIVWLAVLAYVWRLWRRLGRVERELRDALRTQGER